MRRFLIELARAMAEVMNDPFALAVMIVTAYPEWFFPF